MDITVEMWQSTRHTSAEGSGVAHAIKDWAQYCVDPETIKGNPKALAKAQESAQKLRTALAKAKSKLKRDEKLDKQIAELEKKQSKKKDSDVEKKLKEARQNQIKGDEQINKTKDLILDWDQQAEKYIRKVMKADSAQAEGLAKHTTMVKEAIASLQGACNLLEKQQEAFEGLQETLQGQIVQAEGLLARMITAVKKMDTPAIELLQKERDSLVEDLRTTPTVIDRNLKQALDRASKLKVDVRPLEKHELTKSAHARLLHGLDERYDQAKMALSESFVPRLKGLVEEALELAEKVAKAARGGFDKIDEIGEARDALGRAMMRLQQNLLQIDAILVRGADANTDQANMELLNIKEGAISTEEGLTEAKAKIGNWLKQAIKGTQVAEGIIKKAIKNANQAESDLPDGFAQSTANDIKVLLKEWQESREGLDKYEKKLGEVKEKIKKVMGKFSQLK
jgi:NTP pyrophosphatase (non-canonical NTP hydrolase)